ncbi:MAG: hypothetical protein ACRDNS_15880, partial [Trebonia sp.]
SQRVGSARRHPARDVVSIVDLGLVPVDALAVLAPDGERVVIACRATIPGLRQAEQDLDRLEDAEVFLAVVGRRRWPGEVSSSIERRLRALQTDGRVVVVPLDRRLTVTGLTYTPLPKAVLAAGAKLLQALDTVGPPAVEEPSDPAMPVTTQGATR